MQTIDDAINALSPEELDLLNSDPQMLAEFKNKYAPDVAHQNLAAMDNHGPLDELKSMIPTSLKDFKDDVGASRAIGDMAARGIGGIGALVAPLGNALAGAPDSNPDTALNTASDVAKGDKTYLGEGVVGTMLSPDQLAIQEGLGSIMAPAGKAIANLFKNWSEQAARNAIGFMNAAAQKGDISDLSDLAQFVMNPVKIGDKALPAILTQSSNPTEMLQAAQAIKDAAHGTLTAVTNAADTAIAESGASLNLGAIDQNLAKLQSTIETNTPNLGKPLVAQYDRAIADFRNIIDNWKNEEGSDLFAALRNFKTTIGKLMGEGDNVVESKIELQKVYATVAAELDTAATKISPQLGAAYREANRAYTYADDAVEALTRKIKADGVKPLLPSVKEMFTGHLLNGSPALATGLRTASNIISPALGGLSSIASGLTSGAADAIAGGLQAE